MHLRLPEPNHARGPRATDPTTSTPERKEEPCTSSTCSSWRPGAYGRQRLSAPPRFPCGRAASPACTSVFAPDRPPVAGGPSSRSCALARRLPSRPASERGRRSGLDSSGPADSSAGGSDVSGLDDILGGLTGGKGGSGGLDDMLGGLLGGGRGGGGGGGSAMGALMPVLAGLLASGGLSKILGGLKANGLSAQADSWVGTGANQPVSGRDVEQAVGRERIQRSRSSLASRSPRPPTRSRRRSRRWWTESPRTESSRPSRTSTRPSTSWRRPAPGKPW